MAVDGLSVVVTEVAVEDKSSQFSNVQFLVVADLVEEFSAVAADSSTLTVRSDIIERA